jgi:hypothetical protein
MAQRPEHKGDMHGCEVVRMGVKNLPKSRYIIYGRPPIVEQFNYLLPLRLEDYKSWGLVSQYTWWQFASNTVWASDFETPEGSSTFFSFFFF